MASWDFVFSLFGDSIYISLIYLCLNIFNTHMLHKQKSPQVQKQEYLSEK